MNGAVGAVDPPRARFCPVMALVGWLAVGLGAGCRTEIRPVVATAPEGPPRVASPADGGCSVATYTLPGEVPAGAENLGWVRVPFAGTDETTLEALQTAICERGGRAASQVRWNRKPGSGLNVPPVAVEANAWRLP